jgi:hypothetical protein
MITVVDVQVGPRVEVARPRATGWLFVGGAGVLGLVVVALALIVQVRAKQWLGEYDDGTFFATGTRIWISRGIQVGLLLALTAAALSALRRFRRLDIPHRGFALAVGGVFALPVTYLLISGANVVAANWLADSPIPGPGTIAQPHYPPAAPAVARRLFQPSPSDIPSESRAVTLSACERSDGASVAGRVVGLEGPLLVVERVTVFSGAGSAQAFYARGAGCSLPTASPEFRQTAIPLPKVAGSEASGGYLTVAVGTALHGDTHVDLRMRVGSAVISVFAGGLGSPGVAPTLTQIEQLERTLAAAAHG